MQIVKAFGLESLRKSFFSEVCLLCLYYTSHIILISGFSPALLPEISSPVLYVQVKFSGEGKEPDLDMGK